VSGKAPVALSCSNHCFFLCDPYPPVKERRKGLVQCNDYKTKRYNRLIPRDRPCKDVKLQPGETIHGTSSASPTCRKEKRVSAQLEKVINIIKLELA
tara:strand:- start:543 stop:833 length:291 start_codon:yes stop_codon:yes gene_type:complete